MSAHPIRNPIRDADGPRAIMPRVAAVVAVLLLMLTVVGCGTGGGDTTGSGEQSSSPSQTGSEADAGKATGDGSTGTSRNSAPATQAPPTAADGSDVQECFDGDCEIAVSEPVSIPLDGRFSVDAVVIEKIEPDHVSLRAESAGSVTRITSGPGGTVRLNKLTVRVVAVSDGTAVLRFSPTP